MEPMRLYQVLQTSFKNKRKNILALYKTRKYFFSLPFAFPPPLKWCWQQWTFVHFRSSPPGLYCTSSVLYMYISNIKSKDATWPLIKDGSKCVDLRNNKSRHSHFLFFQVNAFLVFHCRLKTERRIHLYSLATTFLLSVAQETCR